MRRFHVLAVAMTIAMLLPTIASAQNMPTQIVTCTGAGGAHPCTCKDLVTTAQNVLYTGIYLAVFLSAVLFAWAGWKLLTGKTMGEHSAIDQGKKIIWNVMIGLVIILAAWLIVNTLFSALTNSRGIGSFCP
jgi:hypothetical protein